MRGPGRPPLPAETRAEITRLVGLGTWSDRAIARRLQVGRTTVRNVRLGLSPQACPPALAPGERPAGDGERCPECGAALEVAPCRACAARRYLAARQQQIRALLAEGERARRARLRDFLERHGLGRAAGGG